MDHGHERFWFVRDTSTGSEKRIRVIEVLAAASAENCFWLSGFVDIYYVLCRCNGMYPYF